MKVKTDVGTATVHITVTIDASPDELEEIQRDLRDILCNNYTDYQTTEELLMEIKDAIEETQ